MSSGRPFKVEPSNPSGRNFAITTLNPSKTRTTYPRKNLVGTIKSDIVFDTSADPTTHNIFWPGSEKISLKDAEITVLTCHPNSNEYGAFNYECKLPASSRETCTIERKWLFPSANPCTLYLNKVEVERSPGHAVGNTAFSYPLVGGVEHTCEESGAYIYHFRAGDD